MNKYNYHKEFATFKMLGEEKSLIFSQTFLGIDYWSIICGWKPNSTVVPIQDVSYKHWILYEH